jgi:hypothetical protein
LTFKANDGKRLRDLAVTAGYWIVPIANGTKRPAIKEWQAKRCSDKALINQADAIGLVMGKNSLWALDVDTKHWAGNKSEFNKKVVDFIHSTFHKDEFTFQQTPSEGLHFVFKLQDVDWSDKCWGNQKYSRNDAGEVVFESRGNGGQIKVYNEMLLMRLDTLKPVRADKISILLEWISLFDKTPDNKPHERKQVSIKPKFKRSQSDAFQEFNESYKDLPLQYLLNNGYTIAGENSIGILIKRPGDTTSTHSGVIYKDSGMLRMFSTSTEFDSERDYSPFDVFKFQSNLENNHDAIELAKKQGLVSDGIDELFEGIKPKKESTIDDLSKTNGLPSYIKTVGEFVKRGRELPPIKGYFGRWISNNAVSMFFAPTGIGKSLAMMYISELVTKGMTFEMDLPNENGPKSVFYIDMELREEDIYDRYPNYAPNSRFYRVQKPVEGDEIYDMYWDMSGHQQLKFWLESSEYIDDLGLVVVDNLSFFFPDEGDVKVGKKLMALLTNHAKSKGCAVVVINHKTKAVSQTGRLSADQMRGTGRLLDLSDYVFMLNRLDNGLTYFQFSKGRNYKGDRSLDEVLQVEKKEDNGMLGFTPVQWIKEADLIASVQVEKTPEQLQKEQQVILLGEEMHEHHMEGKTYREIAKIYKYSHTHVGRLIDKYLATIPLDVLKERGKYSEPQSSESFEL